MAQGHRTRPIGASLAFASFFAVKQAVQRAVLPARGIQRGAVEKLCECRLDVMALVQGVLALRRDYARHGAPCLVARGGLELGNCVVLILRIRRRRSRGNGALKALCSNPQGTVLSPTCAKKQQQRKRLTQRCASDQHSAHVCPAVAIDLAWFQTKVRQALQPIAIRFLQLQRVRRDAALRLRKLQSSNNGLRSRATDDSSSRCLTLKAQRARAAPAAHACQCTCRRRRDSLQAPLATRGAGTTQSQPFPCP